MSPAVGSWARSIFLPNLIVGCGAEGHEQHNSQYLCWLVSSQSGDDCSDGEEVSSMTDSTPRAVDGTKRLHTCGCQQAVKIAGHNQPSKHRWLVPPFSIEQEQRAMEPLMHRLTC